MHSLDACVRVTSYCTVEHVVTITGSQFDVRLFHDAVLSCGMVPLSVLELIVEQYIDRQRQHGQRA